MGFPWFSMGLRFSFLGKLTSYIFQLLFLSLNLLVELLEGIHRGSPLSIPQLSPAQAGADPHSRAELKSHSCSWATPQSDSPSLTW